MKQQKPTIKLSKELMQELIKERLTLRESYEEIITRILVSYRKIEWVQNE